MLHENPNALHHHSLIRTNHKRILKNAQNGIFKGIFPSVPTDGAQVKLMKRKFGQSWNSNIYRKSLSLSRTWQFLPIRCEWCLEIADSSPCTGEVRKPTTLSRQWRKWIGAAELEWAKVRGRTLFNKWYLLDCQDITPENTKRLLQRHRHQTFE